MSQSLFLGKDSCKMRRATFSINARRANAWKLLIFLFPNLYGEMGRPLFNFYFLNHIYNLTNFLAKVKKNFQLIFCTILLRIVERIFFLPLAFIMRAIFCKFLFLLIICITYHKKRHLSRIIFNYFVSQVVVYQGLRSAAPAALSRWLSSS